MSRPAYRATFPLRVRLANGRVVHAGYTHRMYIEGAGETACYVPFGPDDEHLPTEAPVTCAGCQRAPGVKEAQQ